VINFTLGAMMFCRGVKRIYLWSEGVDMRKSYIGLQSIVRHELKLSPLSGDLYVFVNRGGNLIKCLYWDRTGYCVVSKRLEKTRVNLRWSGSKQLSKELFLLIFDGINV
jgi:transposase